MLEGRLLLGSFDQRPWFATLGNFDGMHLGHQKLVAHLIKRAKENGALPAVFTFEPHPMAILDPEDSVALYPLAKKIEFLSEAGVEVVFAIDFNRNFMALSPQAFLKDSLLPFHDLKGLIVGDEFRFGREREGNAAGLVEYLYEWNKDKVPNRHISCETFPIEAAEKILFSSSKVRLLLFNADFLNAAKILGRFWSVEGLVVEGDKLGQKLGFPTANLKVERKLPLPLGVYSVAVRIEREPVRGGVMNFGLRPSVSTINVVVPRLEVHIFDWTENLYGKSLEVIPLQHLRFEKKFNSLDALKNAIQQDAQRGQSLWKQLYQSFNP